MTAIVECEIWAVHLDCQSNRISDHLSKWSLDDSHKQQFFLLTNQFKLQELVITDNSNLLFSVCRKLFFQHAYYHSLGIGVVNAYSVSLAFDVSLAVLSLPLWDFFTVL